MARSLLLPTNGLKIRSRSPLTQYKRSQSSSTVQSSCKSTNYVRYLSHLSPSGCNFEEQDSNPYWQVTTRSLLYLKREQLNTHQDDALMSYLFREHFDLQRLDPYPISETGQALLKNGYFLSAYALFVGRNHRNINFIIKYFASIYKNYDIKIGLEELKWYLKVQSDFNEQLITTKSSQETQQQITQMPIRRQRCQSQSRYESEP